MIIFFILVLTSAILLISSIRLENSTGLVFLGSVRNVFHEISSFTRRTVFAIQELSILRREYAELAARIYRYEHIDRDTVDILQENNRLREQLQFSQSLAVRHIAAEISGRDPHFLFSAFSINKGSVAGIAPDMPVVAFYNGTQALVGKVIEAGHFESLVMPLYDLNFFVSARVAPLRYEGLVNGQGATNVPLRMQSVKTNVHEPVNAGDLVVTSGVGGIYPPDIAIGTVSHTVILGNEQTTELDIESIVDFSRLEYVFVLEVVQSEQSDD
ncbi:MAG: rod shape-determining protein MreC [Treponema sp.]|nr:rod shape-determining protein MreC [Treponema sp.]